MNGYQIAIFAEGAESSAQTLQNTIRRHTDELGLPPDMIKFLDKDAIATRNRKFPIVGVYFGLTPNPKPHQGLSDLLNEGVMVLPVVSALEKFTQYIPKDLALLNGITLDPKDYNHEQVAAVLLEGLGLLRKNRRLFISYKRAETQNIAIQLYELLDAHGFDVFLDTHSIRAGEPFQEVLWHRLADTDVILLLDSPSFLDSRWTTEELAQANSTNIQILQLLWPNQVLQASAAFSTPFPLTKTDFVDSDSLIGTKALLQNACMEKIAIQVETLRARALAARYTYLVQEFCTEARVSGYTPQVQPERFVILQTKTGNYVIAVPTVGVPDAIRYQEIEDEIARHSKGHTDLVLLYDERGIRDKWLKHIDWLDRQLHVKSLQVTKTPFWLEKLR